MSKLLQIFSKITKYYYLNDRHLLLSITIVVDTDKCLSVSITIYQLHFVIYIKKLADFVIFENNAI